jgi:hypothetical protein
MKIKFTDSSTSTEDNTFDCNSFNVTSDNKLSLNIGFSDNAELSKIVIVLSNSDTTKNILIYQDNSDIVREQYVGYSLVHFSINKNNNYIYVELAPEDISAAIDSLKEQIDTLDKQVNPTPVDTSTLTLEETRTYQINIVNAECQAAIYQGTDVETSKGTEHFSLTAEDQTNISTLYSQVVAGLATTVPYHADGELCREFTAEEMIKLGTTALTYVTYCTTKVNHIHAWINRETDKDTILGIHFTSDLVSDLAENMEKIINATTTDDSEADSADSTESDAE